MKDFLCGPCSLTLFLSLDREGKKIPLIGLQDGVRTTIDTKCLPLDRPSVSEIEDALAGQTRNSWMTAWYLLSKRDPAGYEELLAAVKSLS